MAVRDIIVYSKNEAVLRQKSLPVRKVNRYIKKLIQDLKDTLAEHPEGIGLAAPQINIHSRVAIVRLGGKPHKIEDEDEEEEIEPGPPEALINPEIVEAGSIKKDFDGCLSLPGLYGDTVRPHYLRVTGLNEQGEPFDRTFEGFDAVVVHHEIDHLDGILFIDRVLTPNDLYRVERDKNDKLVRVPVAKLGR
jgi:peptide deformylase